MQCEHLAERLVPRGAQATELQSFVVGVVPQVALSGLEKRFATVRAHRAHVERELEIARAGIGESERHHDEDEGFQYSHECGRPVSGAGLMPRDRRNSASVFVVPTSTSRSTAA